MKRLFALFSVAFVSAFALAILSPGCSNPCEDLADVCARCGDSGYRASCETVVAKNNGGVCSGNVASFRAFCTGEGAGGSGGSEASPQCNPAETLCVNTCVNLIANATFCGSCNVKCNEGELCMAGQCVAATQCPPSLPDANESGGCTDRQSDSTCCGDTCVRCGKELACVNGKCAPPDSCVGTVCTGACTDLYADPQNCGKCGNLCKAGEVCANGQCASTCGDKLTQCCGKCVDLATSAEHCGGCDPSCPEVQGGQGGGSANPPSYGVCSGVHADCAGDTPICATCQCVNITQCTEIQKKTVCSNTCVDTLTDPKHCGGCGMACGVDKKCANGVCISGDCPVGQTACDGSCANLQTDAKNCGSCGSACKLGEVCDGGVCASTCTLPTQPCGTSCVDVSKDPKNCGACGTACASGQVCASDANGNASCLTSCPSGLTDCGGACVDLRKDFNHCGSCGNSCNDDNVCTADSCTFGEQGGQCDNVSGAKLCPGADKPCEESKCDPKLGCVSKPLSAAAIVAGCSFAPNIPSGWSSDDVSNKQAYCLWCNPLAASTAQACVFSEREDEYGCTIDACDPKRLAGPSHGKDNTYCQKQQANTQCCAESLAAGTGCAKTCP